MTVPSPGAVRVSSHPSSVPPVLHEQYPLTPPDFSGSAEDIELSIEGDDNVPILRAKLNPVDGDPVDADINLAERIGNDGGNLVFGV